MDLDKSGRPTARRLHALVQDHVNSTEHLSGVVTNGSRIRLLRDSRRQSFKGTCLKSGTGSLLRAFRAVRTLCGCCHSPSMTHWTVVKS